MCYDLDIFLTKNKERFTVEDLSLKLQNQIAAKKVRSKAKRLISDIEIFWNKMQNYPQSEFESTVKENEKPKKELKKKKSIVVEADDSGSEEEEISEDEDEKAQIEKIKIQLKKSTKKPTKVVKSKK